jgi:HAE1 family hydrophobic/amphiphilic exporter-1
MTNLPVARYPEITPPQVLVSARYWAPTAVAVEQAVATPLEQQVNGVERMLYLQSTNAGDGTMTLRVTFEVGTDPDTAQVLAQNRITQATPRLPSQVVALGLTTRKLFPSPLVAFALYSPDGTYDNRFLSNYATINVIDRLLRIDGVATCASSAGRTTPCACGSTGAAGEHGPDAADLSRAILRQSTVNPAGTLGAEPVPPGQEFTYTIRAQGRLVSAEQFGQVVVRAEPDGSFVRLKDVARVELGTETYAQSGRYKGAPSAVIACYQLPGSNALEVRARSRRRCGRPPPASRATSGTRWPSTPPRRWRRASARSSSPSSRPSSWSPWWSSSSCRPGRPPSSRC